MRILFSNPIKFYNRSHQILFCQLLPPEFTTLENGVAQQYSPKLPSSFFSALLANSNKAEGFENCEGLAEICISTFINLIALLIFSSGGQCQTLIINLSFYCQFSTASKALHLILVWQKCPFSSAKKWPFERPNLRTDSRNLAKHPPKWWGRHLVHKFPFSGEYQANF